MNKLFNIHTLISLCSSLLMMTSCELMDFDDVAVSATSMYLERDTLYCMIGDTVRVMPVFKPDTVTVSDLYWSTSDENVATVFDSHIVGVGEGWATFTAVSVSKRMVDSCHVCVMPRWQVDDAMFPYEMVLYADVTMDGKPFSPNDVIVAAFCGDECRGVGVMKESKGKQYLQLRIGGSFSNFESIYSGPNVVYDDEEELFRERIVFQCYDRKNHLLKKAKRGLIFDGETHGYISNLYKLEF